MKKLKFYHLIYFVSLLLVQSVFAQAPQGMNYQAIARDVAGAILPNQTISIRATITNGSGGQVLYEETFNVTTNQFGSFALNIGNGTPVTGTFASISWATVSAWMQVEMDPNGGSNYVNMGTEQLLSVPYALYAANGSAAGQSSTSVFGTGTLTVTSTDTLRIVPGLIQTVNVPAGTNVLISTCGGIQTSDGSTAAGYSIIDIEVYIDGAFAGPGFYKRVVAANNTGIGGMITNWSMTASPTLTPGSHTIDVRAVYTQGATANVSSDGSSVLQGSLTATVIKN